MFSYVDPSVAERLIAEGKLRTVDFDGQLVPREDDKAYLSVLGPVPMPRKFKDNDTLKEIKGQLVEQLPLGRAERYRDGNA